MKTYTIYSKNKKTVLALGPESDGNFSVYLPLQYFSPLAKGKTQRGSKKSGRIYFSDSFGDLLEEKNFAKFKKEVLDFLKKNKLRPDVILTDLHPLYRTTGLGKELAKKFKAKHIKIQHHLAHIFSAIGDKMITAKSYKLKAAISIACDGTGYGSDGNIWGGEIFQLEAENHKLKANRIGHLENQILIGGDLAIREPARMLIGILDKFLDKKEIHARVKKYYSKNEFELLYNQLRQNFNCQETSSTGRILDAASVLLGFCKNKRNYKHEPIDLLEKNSNKPYSLKPVIENNILMTTPLFEYLIKNLSKDKKRLAATAQMYLAEGLHGIIKQCHPELASPVRPTARDSGSNKKKIPDQVRNDNPEIFFAGGIANNKIISDYLESRGVYTNKKVPRGDAGLSFGQIVYYLTNPRN